MQTAFPWLSPWGPGRMEGGAHSEAPADESELHLWYDTEDDLKEQLPTELDTSSHSRYLAANKDKLTIRYVGKGNHSDFGSVSHLAADA